LKRVALEALVYIRNRPPGIALGQPEHVRS
jgi:hypothetical protein